MGRLESILALDPVLFRAVVDCRIAHGFLYLRENCTAAARWQV